MWVFPNTYRYVQNVFGQIWMVKTSVKRSAIGFLHLEWLLRTLENRSSFMHLALNCAKKKRAVHAMLLLPYCAETHAINEMSLECGVFTNRF